MGSHALTEGKSQANKCHSRSINTDVLIVGSGAAGMRAAIEAAEAGCHVTVLNKGSSNNCTQYADTSFEIAGGGGCGLSAPFSDEDSPQAYFDDLNRIGGGRNKSELTRWFAEDAAEAINYVRHLGVVFETLPADSDGEEKLKCVPEIWHQLPRMVYSKKGTGHEVLRVLTQKALSLGVELLDNTFAYRLTKNSDGIDGCIAIDQKSQQLVNIGCRSLILATGGAGGLFTHTTNPKRLTGDGILLAHEVGAHLYNMDLYNDIPMSVTRPYALGFVPKLLLPGVKYSVPELLAMERVTWKLDQEKLSVDMLAQAFPETHARLIKSGFDLASDSIDFGWVAHFMLGGVEIDRRCQTNVAGLFVAGELAGGLNGAGRLPGTGIVDGLVLGKQAGISAAEFAWQQPKQDANIQVSMSAGPALVDEDIKLLGFIREALADLLFAIFRDKRCEDFSAYQAQMAAIEQQLPKLPALTQPDYLPQPHQAQRILECRSALAFSRIYLSARMAKVISEGARHDRCSA